MRWTNHRRLLLGGTTVAALLLVQGLVKLPQLNDPADIDNAIRLPIKVERMLQKSDMISTVAYQDEGGSEGVNTIQQPILEEDVVNKLREEPKVDRATTGWSESDYANLFVDDETASGSDSLTMKADVDSHFSDSRGNSRGLDKPVNSSIKKTSMETPAAAPAPLPDATPVPSAARRPVEMPVVGTHYSISESVAQKGAHHIEYGKTLARRNATFAARQEFYYALQLVAQSYDNQAGGATHTQSLNKALTALREAEDFYVADSETQIGLNIVAVVETHLTKLVSSEEARSMTALKIMQIYCSYARDQFAAAGGHNVVSAEAFYCLGKLSSVMSKADSHANRLNVVKAIVYHRASLACDPNNYRSANELGTLLARNGQLEDAKELLTSSLLIQQTPPAWKNLSIVHRRLGENRLAQLAIAEYEFSLQAPLNPGNPSEIQWVAPEEFNSTGPIEYHESVARQPAFPVSPAAETPQPKSESLLDKLKNWF